MAREKKEDENMTKGKTTSARRGMPYFSVSEIKDEGIDFFDHFIRDEKGKRELRKLLNFSFHYNEDEPMFYNLMIIVEDDSAIEAASDFAEKLLIFLNQNGAYNVSKNSDTEEVGESTLFRVLNEGKIENVFKAVKGKNVVFNRLINHSLRKSDYEDDMAPVTYRIMNDICMCNKGLLHIVIATEEVAKECIKRDKQLYYRTFGHRIHVRNLEWEEVTRLTLVFLSDGYGYDISNEFANEFAIYVQTIYEDADLKNEIFVKDLINRLVTNFHSSKHRGRALTIDCIPSYDRSSYEVSAIDQLKAFRGIESITDELEFLTALANDDKSEVKQRYHMIFAGNPGTGKTTVAKYVAGILYQAGLIERNKVVVLNANDMCQRGYGDGAKLLKENVKKAQGGILFIDEAHNIADYDKNREVTQGILYACENDNVTFIFAGYKKEMKERFLSLDSGITSRIYKTIEFKDYSEDTLVDIFLDMCEKEEFTVTDDAVESLRKRLGYERVQKDFGNVRTLEKIFQEIKAAYFVEYKNNQNIPREITIKHVEHNQPTLNTVNLDDFVGLGDVKDTFKAFEQKVNYTQYLKEKGVKVPSANIHMLFTGNPGTGKTTVAKAVADYLFKIGVLKSNKLTIVERKDLIAEYVGQTAPKTNKVIEEAMGGVLFIDEAYSLTPSDSRRDFGEEAIDTLITAMEDHKDNLVVIFAGYEKEMDRFIESNPGIQSRIGYKFHFKDYSIDELTEIFVRKLTKSGFLLLKSAKDQAKKVLSFYADMPNFGNGRFVESLVSRTIANRAKREYNDSNYNKISKDDIPTISEINKTLSTTIQLYDPGKRKEEAIYRTAVHELGHAVVSYIAFPERKIESISISENTSSLGRVTLGEIDDNMTEQQMRGLVATMLAGRNAERLILNDSTSGCSSDYRKAKSMAREMINTYAMGEIGVTKPNDILMDSDKRATEILEKYRKALEGLISKLLKEKDISGEEFAKYMKKYVN